MNPAHLLQCGLAQQRAGALGVAAMFFEQALRLQPRCAEALHQLGLIRHHVGDSAAALGLFETALRADPTLPELHTHHGMALRSLGQPDAAATAHRRALELRPDYADAHYNLGNALKDLGEVSQALAAYRRADVLQPRQPDILTNLGATWRDLGCLDEALACYDAALRVDPDFAKARWNRSLIYLQRGDWTRGWDEYEWRWRVPGLLPPRRAFLQPEWDGGDLGPRTILLTAEQGFGDTIQFCRYASVLAARGARVIVECQPALQSLLETLPGVAQVVPAGAALPSFDLHASLLSVPRWCRPPPDGAVPAPYLRAPAVAARLPAIRPGVNLKVGLAWRGNPANDADRFRSLPLSEWLPFLRTTGVDFYSLQCGPTATAELDALPGDGRVVDLGPELHDFAATARALAQLDLVISVCTSVAHLAGALGRPVWTLLAANGCWRWGVNREDSPWYPSMRLFRQPKLGDWRTVVQRVAAALVMQVDQGAGG